MKNVIQLPLEIEISDLPDNIKLNKKFRVKDESYICELGDSSSSYVCEKKDGNETSVPEQIDAYYIIRKYF